MQVSCTAFNFFKDNLTLKILKNPFKVTARCSDDSNEENSFMLLNVHSIVFTIDCIS